MVGSRLCAKTLLAKAIAGEADASFFSISGSGFCAMFVGVGAGGCVICSIRRAKMFRA